MALETQPGAANRRTFLKTLGAAAMTLGSPIPMAATSAAADTRFGVDMFSLGAQQWTPFQQMDWAAKWNVKMVHFSEIRFLGSPDWQIALDPANLRRIRARADELRLDIEIGMRSICPTSSAFDAAAGTAQEQLGRMIGAATIMRSPIVRCVLGTQADRRGPIEKHIDETVKVLKTMRSRALDAGVKIAIENHAGDMQARELKSLVEAAGPEYVGVCIDSGNAVWTIEDPHLTLETLAPYVLTSHMRDSYVFNSPQGTAVQWSRMGDGNIGMDDYLRKYVAQCPGKAVSLEVIVSGTPRIFNYRNPQAWELFRTTPAWEFARFLALCDKGTPRPLPPPGQGRGQGGPGRGQATAAGVPVTAGAAPGVTGPPPAGVTGAAAQPGRGRGGPPDPEAQKRNLEDVEASVRWTQAFLATL
jgi:sugar phosphate isomerase/epimerase